MEPELASPLLLNIDQFLTECCWDHVYIYDGNSASNNLLAVLSGLQTGRQLSIPSGKAVVHFVSDLAYNLEGFTISYSWGTCPKNCSQHGDCKNGKCQCIEGFTGEFCEFPICEKDGLTAPCLRGVCENGRCKSTIGLYNGNYCQGLHEGVWDHIHTKSKNKFTPRASHAMAVNDNKAWIFGGFYFRNHGNHDLTSYDFTTNTFHSLSIINTPPQTRYDHSMVYYKDKLYIFGGVINNKTVTNELWSLDLGSGSWKMLRSHNESPETIPKAVAGHTAHVINDKMYVFFGYNPTEGYVHRVQIYNFVDGTWKLGKEQDSIIGRFGHSSTLYLENSKMPVVYVYGGYNQVAQEAAYNISNDLLKFEPMTETWTDIGSGLVRVFRHTAVIIDHMLYIIGGNSHNESTTARLSECYSGEVYSYDILCQVWAKVPTTKGPISVSRYGHLSAEYNGSVYVFGGFNGLMNNDVLKLSLPQCNSLANSEEECTESATGVRCIFVDKKCIKASTDVSYRQSFLSLIKGGTPRLLPENCPGMNLRSTQCSEHKDCQSCFNQKDCGWCESTLLCVNSDTSCADGSAITSDSKSCPAKSKTSSQTIQRPCSLATNCFACHQLPHCSWYMIEAKHVCILQKDEAILIEQHNRIESERLASIAHSSIPAASSLTDFRYLQPFKGNSASCPVPCSNLTDCSSCTQRNCMWCPSTRRCVNMDTYMISFPYGQCQSWITQANSNNNHACQLDPYDCSLQKTCEECQQIGPRCGWCDNGEGTGVGECIAGSTDGPFEKHRCMKREAWYFTGTPHCQCNGHSQCSNNTIEICSKCHDDTAGEHCERCADGYFGDPRNGGNCTECQCHDQAHFCDNENGDCYCTTKGVIGAHCDKCDTKYEGDPTKNRPCSYKLAIDFIFTFKLDNNDVKDKYVNKINFFSIPFKDDTDLQFSISCDAEYDARVDISKSRTELDGEIITQKVLSQNPCNDKTLKKTYHANDKEWPFGTIKNTTFHVTVYNFTTPIKIQISFAQSPPINWVLFFVIFAACFVVLLVVAGLVWIIKQRVERYHLMQTRHVEIERMASRPFASAQLDLSPNRYDSATPISIEPCSNYQAGIYTLIVRLPTGGKEFTPHGTSGLAVASSLCTLTQSQLALLQPPEADGQQANQKSSLRRFISFKNPFSSR
uniref:Laminin EGF-like domain-containing protein n=1 Tax=Panagrolaimus sp. JU765 TaxID=591449 RepID=A0AC34RET9_9BILA